MLTARALSRSFHGRSAVTNVTFAVPQGKLFVLLGPNGAGKTTTVRLLLGLIAPTSGSAEVAGFEVGREVAANDKVRAACGLLTETPGFYDRMSAWENLQFFARLYRIPAESRDSILTEQLRVMGLWERRDDLVGTYSKGMKQKLAIIRAVFHDPKVIFFDEPTSGLDPEAALMVNEMIGRLKHEGRTIVVCTHNLDEAERLADLVGILRGRLLVFASLADLQRGDAGVVDIEFAAPLPAGLANDPRILKAEGLRCTFAIGGRDDVPPLVRSLVDQNAQVVAVRPRGRDLQSVYLEHIKRAEAEA